MPGFGPVSAIPVSHHAVVGLAAAPTATLPVLSAPTLVWVSGNTYKPQVVATYEWSPSELFASSEDGGWYEPGPTTCYTDDGVTAAGENDLVYRIDDLSGNGHHLYQTTEAYRPRLRKSGALWYLEFDGSDDQMSVTFGSAMAQPSSLAMAFDPGASVSYRAWLGAIASTGTNRTTLFNGGTGADERWFAGSNLDIYELSANTKTVLVGEFDGANSWCKQDGAAAETGNAGTNNADGIVIGSLYSTGTYYAAIKVYGLLRLGRAFSESEITAVEEWAAGLSGVTLA